MVASLSQLAGSSGIAAFFWGSPSVGPAGPGEGTPMVAGAG